MCAVVFDVLGNHWWAFARKDGLMVFAYADCVWVEAIQIVGTTWSEILRFHPFGPAQQYFPLEPYRCSIWQTQQNKGWRGSTSVWFKLIAPCLDMAMAHDGIGLSFWRHTTTKIVFTPLAIAFSCYIIPDISATNPSQRTPKIAI